MTAPLTAPSSTTKLLYDSDLKSQVASSRAKGTGPQ